MGDAPQGERTLSVVIGAFVALATQRALEVASPAPRRSGGGRAVPFGIRALPAPVVQGHLVQSPFRLPTEHVSSRRYVGEHLAGIPGPPVHNDIRQGTADGPRRRSDDLEHRVTLAGA